MRATLIVAATTSIPQPERAGYAGELLRLLICLVFAFNAFAALLVVLRGKMNKVPVYRPMLWNIVLSMAQLGIFIVAIFALLFISGFSSTLPSSLHTLATFGVWLFGLLTLLIWTLALPNSSYLITELNLNHRAPKDPTPLWFDIIATLSLTLSGLVNAFVGLALVQTVVSTLWLQDGQYSTPFPTWQSWLFALSIIVASNFGIYLGRYLRLNSWDIKHPASMVKKFMWNFKIKKNRKDMLGFTITYTAMMCLLYPLFYLPVHFVYWQNQFL